MGWIADKNARNSRWCTWYIPLRCSDPCGRGARGTRRRDNYRRTPSSCNSACRCGGRSSAGFPLSFKGSTSEGTLPRNSQSGAALPSRFTKTKFSQVSTRMGTRPLSLAIEIAHTFEFHHALERPVVSISPSMIRATELFGASGDLGFDGSGVMAAHVVKGAELAIFTANDKQRLSIHIDREKLAGSLHLIEPSDHLPIDSEYAVAFQLGDARVEIPRSGDRPGSFQWIGRIVHTQDFAMLRSRIGRAPGGCDFAAIARCTLCSTPCNLSKMRQPIRRETPATGRISDWRSSAAQQRISFAAVAWYRPGLSSREYLPCAHSSEEVLPRIFPGLTVASVLVYPSRACCLYRCAIQDAVKSIPADKRRAYWSISACSYVPAEHDVRSDRAASAAPDLNIRYKVPHASSFMMSSQADTYADLAPAPGKVKKEPAPWTACYFPAPCLPWPYSMLATRTFWWGRMAILIPRFRSAHLGLFYRRMFCREPMISCDSWSWILCSGLLGRLFLV